MRMDHRGVRPAYSPEGVFYSAGHPTEAGACGPRALRRALPHIHDRERRLAIRPGLPPGKRLASAIGCRSRRLCDAGKEMLLAFHAGAATWVG